MTIKITWHEPPATTKYGKLLEEFVTALKERPGDWAELEPEGPNGWPSAIQTQMRKRYPKSQVEVRSVVFEGSRSRIRLFARWLADGDPEAAARSRLKPVK